jgi:hypothetical protein
MCAPLQLTFLLDLFSDDFDFKMNTLVSNLAHIFILRRPLIILSKNIVYLEGILHFRQCSMETRGEPSGIRQLVFRKRSMGDVHVM